MFGNISIWQLLIVLAIIVLLFGTKKLRGIGADLGSAIKGFRSSIKDEAEPDTTQKSAQLPDNAAENNDKNKASAAEHSTKDKV